MTKRDTFLTRSQFMQLLYAACCPSRPGADSVDNLRIPAPALIVPKKLYTGKQVGPTSWVNFSLGTLSSSSTDTPH